MASGARIVSIKFAHQAPRNKKHVGVYSRCKEVGVYLIPQNTSEYSLRVELLLRDRLFDFHVNLVVSVFEVPLLEWFQGESKKKHTIFV